ncbi:MAG: hypothetical protein CO126_07340 [Hydrogenophilales bacterium CG_4_9_14_3_um_filter_63_34]|nr:MAG: hypothetical protein COZ24_01685 [Hydrogenophilales bacterium CG_4_10_14_3_um_filter_63_21]PJB03327.1 MAG: hypothetical protein CO126_07340 [Hydrogenophilales bacterium CG_4_9_14_3_um_filter_63_34]
MFRFSILLLPLALFGCGVETVGTAAVVATAKKQEIEQGRQLKESIKQQMDAAALLEQQRLQALEAGADGK